jgi:uncharacterized protein (DUF3084 family)
MREAQADLEHKLQVLNASMGKLETAKAAVEKELQQRQQALQQAQTEVKTAQGEAKEAQGEAAAATGAAQRAGDAARRIGASTIELGREKDQLQRDIESLRVTAAEGIAAERTSPVLFSAGQALDWKLINADRPVKLIRADIDKFVADLDQPAREAGAKPLPGTEEAVVVRKPVREEKSQNITWFNREQVLGAVAERVHETSGSVILQAFSVFNTHYGEPIRVDFELFRNALVYHKGETLATAYVDGRQSESVLLGSLLALLRKEVSPRARAKNIMPRSSDEKGEELGVSQETVGEIGIEELLTVVEKLRAIAGPAKVTAVAQADTWTIGPLEVDINVSSSGNTH